MTIPPLRLAPVIPEDTSDPAHPRARIRYAARFDATTGTNQQTQIGLLTQLVERNRA